MTRRALSLQAYLAYRHGLKVPYRSPELPDRPDGAVVWAVADNPEQGRSLASLFSRLSLQRPDISMMVSGDFPARSDLIPVPRPSDRSYSPDQFANQLHPDIVLWTGHMIEPALLDALSRQGAHMVALDAEDEVWTSPSPRWMPDPTPAALSLFDKIYTINAGASRRLRRLGVPSSLVQRTGALIDTDLPLPCSDRLHEETSSLLTGRPIWLAAHVGLAEMPDVLTAHRRASRLAHRLLLIVAPDPSADIPAIRSAIADAQMRVCDWDDGDLPDENTQILFAQDPADLGLWYRLAPLTFLGDSLANGAGGQDPFVASTLGTAILYGPHVKNHISAYSRLVDAGAARIVRDADTLAAAVTHLTAADQAALMALAGWDVVSSGAALVDRIIAEICTALDAKAPA